MRFFLPLLVFFAANRSVAYTSSGPFSGHTEKRSLLVYAKRDTIWVDYRPDHRILYEGQGWRVVMVDSETVALVTVSVHAQLRYPNDVRMWQVVNASDRKLRVSL